MYDDLVKPNKCSSAFFKKKAVPSNIIQCVGKISIKAVVIMFLNASCDSTKMSRISLIPLLSNSGRKQMEMCNHKCEQSASDRVMT